MRFRFGHRLRALSRRVRHFRFVRENWYRDIWLLLVTAWVLWATTLSFNNQNQTRHVQMEQRHGRAISLTATCATLSGVIQAGRATILGGVIIKPREFERNLERMGLPPRASRERSAMSAADAYAAAIATRVEQETGKRGLIRKDGTLDCALLRRIGRAK